MPYHLAIHKVVADVAPHESPGRNEFHAQQSIRRCSVSAKKNAHGLQHTGAIARGVKEIAKGLLSIPEERDEAREGDRSVGGLQFGHQLPSLSPAIRAGCIGPCFRQRVPAQTGVYIRQDDRQRSVHEKDLPRQPRRFWVGERSGKKAIKWSHQVRKKGGDTKQSSHAQEKITWPSAADDGTTYLRSCSLAPYDAPVAQTESR